MRNTSLAGTAAAALAVVLLAASVRQPPPPTLHAQAPAPKKAVPAKAAGVMSVRAAKSYKPYDPIVLTAQDVSSDKAQFLWDIDGPAQVVEAGPILYVWAPPGTYKGMLTAVDFETKKIERARFAFTVEGESPGPGPTPPGPPPPTPTPPQPVKGMKVLILYESSEEAKMPRPQQLILRTPEVRDWLNAHCDGSTETMSGKAWVIWDKDVDASAMSKGWRDVLKRPHPSMPWIVVFNDAAVAFEGPLPADTQATIALLSKYAPSSRRKAG